MILPDLTLARRLELHEAWSSREHVRIQAQSYPATGAAWLPVGAGCAVFAGRNAPLSRVYGWGLDGPAQPAELDEIEAFYRERGLPARLRLTPFVEAATLALLGERGYRVDDFLNVFVRSLDALPDAPPSLPGLRIAPASPDEARLWFERSGAGGDWAEPDGVSFMVVRSALKPNTQLFLAWLDGEMVSGGALAMSAGVACLMAAGTLPAYRRRGLHTALLRVRLAVAAAAGCDVALVHTRPGAISQNNALRAGFELAYTAMTMSSAH